MSVVLSAFGPDPVTVGQVRMHTRIDDNAEDALLLDYIATAREKIEQWTGLLLRPCTLTLTLDAFANPILLPGAPVRSITIAYTDSDGDAQTVAGADYVLREYAGRYQVELVSGASWPSIEAGSQIVITAAAGFETPNDVPMDLKAVIYRMVAHQYEMRGEEGGLEGFGSQVVNHRLEWAF